MPVSFVSLIRKLSFRAISDKNDVSVVIFWNMITAEDEKLLKAINAEPVKMFLTAALQAKSKGDLYNYNHIVHQLRIRDDPEMVACVYVGLASCVSLFSNR